MFPARRASGLGPFGNAVNPRKRARPPITDGRRSAAREAVLRNTLASPLAAVSLALPGQTAPSRHHHCPAHLAAAPPRVRTPPGPFYEVGFVALSLPRSAGIGWARPGPCLARDGQTPSLQGCTRGVSWTGPPDPGAGFLERKVFGILPGLRPSRGHRDRTGLRSHSSGFR